MRGSAFETMAEAPRTNVRAIIDIRDDEGFALGIAVAHNCTCASSQGQCPSCAMLNDERILKHLVFVRRVAEVFMCQEFSQS